MRRGRGSAGRAARVGGAYQSSLCLRVVPDQTPERNSPQVTSIWGHTYNTPITYMPICMHRTILGLALY